MATAASESQRNQVAQVRQQLDTMLGQFAAVLPSHIPARLFTRVVLTAIQNKPELLECDRRSLWNASMRAAQDGLLPDGRLGAMVVFKDKRLGKVAQWMPMIAGIRQKVRNSGEISTWECHVVRERDMYEYELGDDARIVHRPARGPRGEIIAAYSIALLKTGERSREWMWREELDEIRARSRSPDSGPWQTDYSEMCRKTVARRHSKVLPMSTDILALLDREQEPIRIEDAPPTAPEPAAPRALTDALNMLAGQQPEDREPAPADHGDADGDFIDNDSGEVTSAADTAQQQEAAPKLTNAEIERCRLMLREGFEQDMLEEIWRRFPAEVQKALESDYRALKYQQGGQ